MFVPKNISVSRQRKRHPGELLINDRIKRCIPSSQLLNSERILQRAKASEEWDVKSDNSLYNLGWAA